LIEKKSVLEILFELPFNFSVLQGDDCRQVLPSDCHLAEKWLPLFLLMRVGPGEV
jgi:hypothetical protein